MMSPFWGFEATSHHIWIRGQGWKRNKGQVSFLTSAFAAHPQAVLCIRHGDPIDTSPVLRDSYLINYENNFRWTNISYFRMMKCSCWQGHEFWKSLNEYFMIENEWEWIIARAIWSHNPADLCGIACKVTSALASLFTSIFDIKSMGYIYKNIQIVFCSHWKKNQHQKVKSISNRKYY